tara:strand:- start:3459 stop:3743 length:285 start_codon:yes stop_codon:yes gene_type:complete
MPSSKINFSKLISKKQSQKCGKSKSKSKSKKSQKGGVGFLPNVNRPKIGGQAEISRKSDCFGVSHPLHGGSKKKNKKDKVKKKKKSSKKKCSKK